METIDKRLTDLEQAFLGALLAHKFVLAEVIARSTETATAFLRLDAEALKDWLLAQPLSDSAMDAFMIEIRGVQARVQTASARLASG